MTLSSRGRARLPGPMGTSGTMPGTPLWQKQSGTAPPPATAKSAVKKTVMPLPTNEQGLRGVHSTPDALFGGPKQQPLFDQVKQASGLANCPVASILAALAFTPAGTALLQKLVTETAGPTLTDLTGLDASTLSNAPPGMKVATQRYFTVKLPRGTVEISDVLYTDDADAGWSLIYMSDPGGQSLWAALIEKALAVQLGSYENFDALNISANAFWEKITGTKPGGFAITDKTPLNDIIAAAKASTRVSTIGASKPDSKDVKVVTEFHGHAILGMQGTRIKLYDPAKAKTLLISPADFRHDFQAILVQR